MILHEIISIFSQFQVCSMPKMKTNSGAKKRFSVTGSGKIRRNRAFKNHILTKKATKRKRALGNDAVVTDADMSNVKFMLRLGK